MQQDAAPGAAPDAAALVMLSGPHLVDEVRRIAAAANCALDEQSEPPGRPAWLRSPLVVLDAESAQACIQHRLPRRPGTVLVCAGTPQLADWQIAATIGASRVVELPAEENTLVRILGAQPESGVGNGLVVAVVGGRGGAGASSFAAGLALTAAAVDGGPRVLLVDGDGNGGGIDLVLGVEDRPGPRWPGLVLDGGRVGASALHEALPTAGSRLAVLACARGELAADPAPPAVHAVLDAGRSEGDLVVCDVPRHRSASADAFLETADLVVTVVPAELRASASAEVTTARIRECNPNQGLVVRGPAPGGLRAAELAGALDLPLLAAMRPEPRLAEVLERGGLRLRRRGPLRTACSRVLELLADRPVRNGWAA